MESIDAYLARRRSNGTLRALAPLETRGAGRVVRGGKPLIDFSSNDYLGLARHPRLIEAARQALVEHGVGAGASRLLTGDYMLHHELEEAVAVFKHKERALVFNTGYQANVGVIAALVGRGDAIFSDALSHASQIDGAVLSRGAKFPFRHNDMQHLEELLKTERPKFGRALILTESVFSMDGDKAPLPVLAELKERHDCLLMVDEAHATGIFGPHGGGLVEECGLSARVDLIMGTFSKALGGFGAYIAASHTLVDYLVNAARAFIYSTALPPAIIAADLASLAVCWDEPWRRKRLLEISATFRHQAGAAGWVADGETQIVPLMVGQSQTALAQAAWLQERGFCVLPIRPPSVPEGTARFRFSLCAEHDEADVEAVTQALRELRRMGEGPEPTSPEKRG